MSSLLTQHVRNFGPDRYPGDDVLGRLQSLLRRQMRRHGLLGQPPSFLGYAGVSSWRQEGAFDDIVVDCYIYAILNRLASLQHQAQHSEDIDPLVVHHIGFFLDERLRSANRLGYAVYCNLRGAVEEARAQGRIAVRGLRRGRAVRRSEIVFGEAPRKAPLDRAVLSHHLNQMPGWVEASAALMGTTQAGQAWLFDLLVYLGTQGPAVVRLGDLADIVEERVRRTQASGEVSAEEAVAEGDEGLVELERVVAFDPGVEDRDHWRGIVARVQEALRQEPAGSEARERRLRIWDAVVRHVEEGSGRRIRQADLCRDLTIPAATMHGDIRAIGEVVRRILGR